MKRLIVIATILMLGLGATTWIIQRRTRPAFDRDGGTILVYEMDEKGEQYTPEHMANAIHRRLNPAGQSIFKVSALDGDRFEVRIPRTPEHELQVVEIKELLLASGQLDFRIVANQEDDANGVEAARRSIERAKDDGAAGADLEARAAAGKPPASPKPEQGATFANGFTYTWFELGRNERNTLGLTGNRDLSSRQEFWDIIAEARKARQTHFAENIGLIYSREHRGSMPNKKIDYFLLCRDPVRDPKTGKLIGVTGADLVQVNPTTAASGKPAVAVRFTPDGGDRFRALTFKNQPIDDQGRRFYRFLAIILDRQIETVPRLNGVIGQDAVIEGNFTPAEVDRYCRVLRAGEFPALLRPIREEVVGPSQP